MTGVFARRGTGTCSACSGEGVRNTVRLRTAKLSTEGEHAKRTVYREVHKAFQRRPGIRRMLCKSCA
eukprot:1455326-Rhodomonas_salina.1